MCMEVYAAWMGTSVKYLSHHNHQICRKLTMKDQLDLLTIIRSILYPL